MGICQEKFQLEFMPLDDDNGHEWKEWRSANVKKGTPGRVGKGEDWASKGMDNAVFYPSLPPGSDIVDQEMADIRVQPLVTSGTSDVSMDTNPESMRSGYTRKAMRPTDDMYTNEHCDAFYGEAKVDGEVGFLERNNMLDRL
jgi:hypothetical protein